LQFCPNDGIDVDVEIVCKVLSEKYESSGQKDYLYVYFLFLFLILMLILILTL
jgi:hypothetical protein